nr:Chain C, RESIDUE PEPTIDE1I7U_F Chain F, RESIDUE PEPTIDE
ALWGFVPVL